MFCEWIPLRWFRCTAPSLVRCNRVAETNEYVLFCRRLIDHASVYKIHHCLKVCGLPENVTISGKLILPFIKYFAKWIQNIVKGLKKMFNFYMQIIFNQIINIVQHKVHSLNFFYFTSDFLRLLPQVGLIWWTLMDLFTIRSSSSHNNAIRFITSLLFCPVSVFFCSS